VLLQSHMQEITSSVVLILGLQALLADNVTCAIIRRWLLESQAGRDHRHTNSITNLLHETTRLVVSKGYE